MEATVRGELIGSSARMIDLREEVDRIGKSHANVLLTGERGVGKELVARGIHARGSRSGNLLLTMNCAGLPDTLLEWELFGRGKGSWNGWSRDLPGKLALAHGGTILLNNLGEMTLRLQGRLLWFLETGELHQTDASGVRVAVDVRVMASTSRSLRQ